MFQIRGIVLIHTVYIDPKNFCSDGHSTTGMYVTDNHFVRVSLTRDNILLEVRDMWVTGQIVGIGPPYVGPICTTVAGAGTSRLM